MLDGIRNIGLDHPVPSHNRHPARCIVQQFSGLPVAVVVGRERLELLDPHQLELLGNHQFLVRRERDARHLLAIAARRVDNADITESRTVCLSVSLEDGPCCSYTPARSNSFVASTLSDQLQHHLQPNRSTRQSQASVGLLPRFPMPETLQASRALNKKRRLGRAISDSQNESACFSKQCHEFSLPASGK